MERKKEETFEKKTNRIYFNARYDLIDRSLHGKCRCYRGYRYPIMAKHGLCFMNIPRETEQRDRAEWTPGPRELNTLATQVEQPEILR